MEYLVPENSYIPSKVKIKKIYSPEEIIVEDINGREFTIALIGVISPDFESIKELSASYYQNLENELKDKELHLILDGNVGLQYQNGKPLVYLYFPVYSDDGEYIKDVCLNVKIIYDGYAFPYKTRFLERGHDLWDALDYATGYAETKELTGLWVTHFNEMRGSFIRQVLRSDFTQLPLNEDDLEKLGVIKNYALFREGYRTLHLDDSIGRAGDYLLGAGTTIFVGHKMISGGKYWAGKLFSKYAPNMAATFSKSMGGFLLNNLIMPFFTVGFDVAISINTLDNMAKSLIRYPEQYVLLWSIIQYLKYIIYDHEAFSLIDYLKTPTTADTIDKIKEYITKIRNENDEDDITYPDLDLPYFFNKKTYTLPAFYFVTYKRSYKYIYDRAQTVFNTLTVTYKELLRTYIRLSFNAFYDLIEAARDDKITEDAIKEIIKEAMKTPWRKILASFGYIFIILLGIGASTALSGIGNATAGTLKTLAESNYAVAKALQELPNITAKDWKILSSLPAIASFLPITTWAAGHNKFEQFAIKITKLVCGLDENMSFYDLWSGNEKDFMDLFLPEFEYKDGEWIPKIVTIEHLTVWTTLYRLFRYLALRITVAEAIKESEDIHYNVVGVGEEANDNELLKNIKDQNKEGFNEYIRRYKALLDTAAKEFIQVLHLEPSHLAYQLFGNAIAERVKTHLNQYMDEYLTRNVSMYANKLYPTYSIWFFESDSQKWLCFNDVYGYNALIDASIYKRKDSPIHTAVIRLSNIYNRLSDPSALNRREMFFFDQTTKEQNIWSMYLRPGTPIAIKIGYSTSRKDLPVVFYGRIVEAKLGPIVEITAQSEGAHLVSELWGVPKAEDVSYKQQATMPPDVVRHVLRNSEKVKGFGEWSVVNFLNFENNILDTKPFRPGIKWWLEKNLIWGFNVSDGLLDNVHFPFTNTGALWLKNISGANQRFHWYIVNQTIWDVISEVLLFYPDYIAKTEYFNTDKPFIMRNTLYIGPKDGFIRISNKYSVTATYLLRILLHLFAKNKEFEETFFKENKYTEEAESLRLMLMKILYWDPISLPLLERFYDPETLEKDAELDLSPLFPTPSFTKITELAGLIQDLMRRFRKEEEKFGKTNPWNILKPARKYHMIDSYHHIVKNELSLNAENIYNKIHLSFHKWRAVKSPDERTHAFSPDDKQRILNGNIIVAARGLFGGLWTLIFGTKNAIRTVDVAMDADIVPEEIRPYYYFEKNIDVDGHMDNMYYYMKLYEGAFYLAGHKPVKLIESGLGNILSLNPIHIIASSLASVSALTTKFRAINKYREYLRKIPIYYRVARSLLCKLMEQQYDGTLTILGDPYIEPHDIVFVYDEVNEIYGPAEVREVTHTYNAETGFLTHLKLDAITQTTGDLEPYKLNYFSFVYDHIIHPLENRIPLLTGLTMGLRSLPAGPWTALTTGLGTYLALTSFGVRGKVWRYVASKVFGYGGVEIMGLWYKGKPWIAGLRGAKKQNLIVHTISKMIALPVAFNQMRSLLNIFDIDIQLERKL